VANQNAKDELAHGAKAGDSFGSKAVAPRPEGSRGAGATGGAGGGNSGKVVPPAPKVPAPVKPQHD
jgi:hypothetical protein